MKISAIVLSAMISFSAVAQTTKPKEEKPKTKTATVAKEKKVEKTKKDSLKTSTKNNNKQISADYCPPCGMG